MLMIHKHKFMHKSLCSFDTKWVNEDNPGNK